ncbi:YihY/virulence factor BrkB family protein [Planctomyces sp. SH-PL14]|uniref:YihY/virulence factor BrkB family protein n=1 Tax=Planctomyces sp. SH-PL14 TaxID=1632864 RepID=UPI0018D45A9F|nr:YihY/virulence factor BrkB family protein [Planctomyces sp. SH-PL14]
MPRGEIDRGTKVVGMCKNLSFTWPLLKQTAAEWNEDRAPQLGAALAFYTALSLAPLLVLLLRIAAAIFGDDQAARLEIEHQTQSLMGEEGAEAIQAMIDNADDSQGGLVATILSLVTLLFGASGVFGQLQVSLNTIWEVEPKPGRGVWGFVRDRFLSFAMVLGVAFLLLVSLVVSAGLTFATSYLQHFLGESQFLGGALNAIISTVVISVLFALMFKLLPDVKMAWKDVWLGAIVTAILFSLGKGAIGMYLGHSALSSSYGVAGSLVVLLVWVYYSAQILFFGAELTQVYANQYGSRILPSDNAVPVTEEARAQAGIPRRDSRQASAPDPFLRPPHTA